MDDRNENEVETAKDLDLDLEILELTEATALEEMGASSTVASSSTCQPH